MDKNLINEAKQGNSEAQFKLGLAYWRNRNCPKAERWLRYAAIQGFYQAKLSLKVGIDNKQFMSIDEHINTISIHILERLIKPNLLDVDVKGLSQTLISYLDKKYGLRKQSFEIY